MKLAAKDRCWLCEDCALLIEAVRSERISLEEFCAAWPDTCLACKKAGVAHINKMGRKE